jgi:quercetin dioxygenase-like cupin family protein
MTVCQAPTRPTHELPGARFTTLVSPRRGSAETSVWLLELHADADVVPHRLTREEVFVALEGDAIATLDGAAHRLRAGDALALSPGVEFTLATAGSAPFRAMVCLPVGGQAVVGDGPAFTPPWAE